MPTSQHQVDEFFRANAPADVQHTVAWLLSSGYVLVPHEGASTFGAVFVFEGDSVVRIVVDHSQWSLDVAAASAAKLWQYDLLLAAQSSQGYARRFPGVGAGTSDAPVPEQLPEGVSWRDTLPGILRWIRASDVTESVTEAQRQRSMLMWPRNR
ncbi:hypothetical protein [Antribacter gilvus]|uniref:hypothetical protein n=1 Tax=Antribacter gilvus TaxID=2304675 RepID=UPI000F7AAB8C|nr:hypothetical protein [Antribacter gilvus]